MNKILIVDDDPMMLKLASRILSPHYETATAQSGTEAIAVYASQRPDLILSDLLMPGMTGFEMHRSLQETYGSDIPVMFMTADGSDDIEGIGFDLGASDFIRKPFHPDALLARVENILNNQARIRTLTAEASIDKLTGLLNKASTESRCAEMCANFDGMLIILDLDSFKLVNDIYGHEKGDIILQRFSEMLKGQLSPEDAAGRLGGDEFLIFRCGMRSSDELTRMASTLNTRFKELSDEVLGKETGIPLGVSAGGALVPFDGRDFPELFRRADKALYSVKQNGKHGSAVYHDIYSDADSRRDLKSVCRLLEERTVLNGAYRIGLDAFIQIYQYFARYIRSYCRSAYRLLFTLNADRSGLYTITEIADDFCEVTAKSLRKSDILVQLSKDQFFLLLPDITEPSLDKLVDRIITGWQASALSEGVSVQYEAEAIPTDSDSWSSREGDKT